MVSAAARLNAQTYGISYVTIFLLYIVYYAIILTQVEKAGPDCGRSVKSYFSHGIQEFGYASISVGSVNIYLTLALVRALFIAYKFMLTGHCTFLVLTIVLKAT